MNVLCLRPFLAGASLDPHHSGVKLHTAVLSVLCVMFLVLLLLLSSSSSLGTVQLVFLGVLSF